MIQISNPAAFTIKIQDQIRSVVDRFLGGNTFVLGSMVKEFEESFAGYIGSRDCISVASGTDAIEIALRALGCEEKEVLLVANAGGYGTISCLAIGAIPVYCDVNPSTLLVSIESK